MPTSNDLLALAIARDSESLWNFYIIVSTAILGVLASGKVGAHKAVKGVLALGFFFFALSNLVAIWDISDQKSVLLDSVSDPGLGRVVESLRPIHIGLEAALHLAFDVVILAAILVVRWPTDAPVAGPGTRTDPI